MFAPSNAYPELQSLSELGAIIDTIDAPSNLSKFKQYTNKTIIYSQLGDYFFKEKINESLGSLNSFIIILAHKLDYIELKNVEYVFLKSAYATYARLIPHPTEVFLIIESSIKTKHFLSLNSRATWYRQALFYFFENFNLLDKSYFSYLGSNDRNYLSLTDLDKFIDKNVWYLDGLDINSTRSKIPRSTGIELPSDIDWGIGDIRYYTDCFCSIVTETYAAEEYPFFTEKTFKPILFLQPFLIHGNAGCLRELKEMGFKTFDRWWDEDYDNYTAHKRFESMIRVIIEISTWSMEKVNATYQEMLPTLRHNHKHLTETLPTLYNIEIDQLKEKIKQRIIK
jgi:hypothetical protein